MKKTFITSLALLNITFAANAGIKLGIQAGASISQSTISAIPDLNSIVFVQPGIVSEFKLLNTLNFRPSLNFQRTGFGLTSTTSVGNSVESISAVNNINIPLDLCVPLKLGPGKLLLCAGPSVNYALSGNNRTTTTVGGVTGTAVNTPLSFGNAAGDLGRINWGSNFGLGYQLNNGLELKGNYTLGLTDLENGSTITYKNNVISLMLAYFLVK